MSRFAQETVVITGGASGIGMALVQEYLSLGARVFVLDLKEPQIDSEFQSRFKFKQTDVSRMEQLQAAFDLLMSEWGAPTLWYNNAGVAALGAFDAVSQEEFDRVMEINFGAVVNGTRLALSAMKPTGRGSIINVASLNGSIAAPFVSSYVASKHAVVGFTRALQEEFEQTKSPLRVVLVSPGFVHTPIMKERDGFKFPNWLDWIVDQPEKVADEIIRGVSRGHREINPTLHGKVMLKANQVFPSMVRKSSRLLTATGVKELFGFKPIKK